MKEFVNR